MAKGYIVKDIDGRLSYDEALFLKNPSSVKILDHSIRTRILGLLSKKPMYPAELAKELKLHEQKVYYHIKLLSNAGIIDIAERKNIRGTVAKKFAPKMLNFAVSLSPHWKPIKGILKESRDEKLSQFLDPFIKNDRLNAYFVVGSPDPHGPHKARSRDGHLVLELAYFLGSMSVLSKNKPTILDVNIDLKKEEANLIVLGGPVTNLAMARLNDFLPARFSEEKPWGISGKKSYTEDNVGLVAKIPNPYYPNYGILIVAGITHSGTMAAVMSITRGSKLLLSRFSGQKEFYAIVEGFDLDGDGEIDSVEVHE